MECSEQSCCTCMPRLTEDKSGCMVLYALKFIQFVVGDTSKKRITVVEPKENKRNSKFVGCIGGQEGEDFSNSPQQYNIIFLRNNHSNNRQELESQKEHLICEVGNHLQRNIFMDCKRCEKQQARTGKSEGTLDL